MASLFFILAHHTNMRPLPCVEINNHKNSTSRNYPFSEKIVAIFALRQHNRNK